MRQIASWLIWNKAGLGKAMKVVVVLGSQGGTQMCLDDPQLPGVLPRLSGGSWREALGSIGVKRRNKVTAFNQEAQDAR